MPLTHASRVMPPVRLRGDPRADRPHALKGYFVAECLKLRLWHEADQLGARGDQGRWIGPPEDANLRAVGSPGMDRPVPLKRQADRRRPVLVAHQDALPLPVVVAASNRLLIDRCNLLFKRRLGTSQEFAGRGHDVRFDRGRKRSGVRSRRPITQDHPCKAPCRLRRSRVEASTRSAHGAAL